MADLKISNLPDVSPVNGSEIVPVTKDGHTGRIYVSGILVNSEETTKKYINDINVDVLYPLGSGYYTLSTAISAIPSGNLRKIGSTVTFQSASGVFERWQYIGTSTSTWTTTTLWINTKENSSIRYAKNNTGATVPKGKLVYISGSTGENPLFLLATNTDYNIAARTWGVTMDSINNNAVGRVIHFGMLENLDTSAYTAGTELWLGVNGAFTNVRPTSPAFQTSIGMVIRQHATVGSIFVNMRYVTIEGVRSQNPNSAPSSKLLDDNILDMLANNEEVNANANDFLNWKYKEISDVNRNAATDRVYSSIWTDFELGFTPKSGSNYKIVITTDIKPDNKVLSFTLTNSLNGYDGIVSSGFKVYSNQGSLESGRTVFVHIPDNISAKYITGNIGVASGNINIKTYEEVGSSYKEFISGNNEIAINLSDIKIGGDVSAISLKLEKGYIYEFSEISNSGNDINFYYHPSANQNVMIGKLNHNQGINNFKYNCEFNIDTVYLTNYSDTTNFSITLKKRKVRPLNVILDTDFGGDCDDIFAVSLLLLAQKAGKVNIMGINASVQRVGSITGIGQYTVPTAISAMCNYFGFPYEKLGIDKTESSGSKSHYCATLCLYPHPSIPDPINYLDYVDDSPIFYRKLLANLPDGETCNVAIVGAPMGFSRFLNSQADSISNKTGIELALEKIDTLFWMGGKYPSGYETNFSYYSIADSQNILNLFTNRIIFIGVEWDDVHCGDVLYNNNMTYSMLYKVMNEFMVDAFNNGDNPWGYTTLEKTWHGKTYAWDPLTVMAMCINNISFNGYLNYVLSDIGMTLTQGTNVLDNNGTNTFTPNSTGNHYVASKTANHNADWFTYRLDAIIKDRFFK